MFLDCPLCLDLNEFCHRMVVWAVVMKVAFPGERSLVFVMFYVESRDLFISWFLFAMISFFVATFGKTLGLRNGLVVIIGGFGHCSRCQFSGEIIQRECLSVWIYAVYICPSSASLFTSRSVLTAWILSWFVSSLSLSFPSSVSSFALLKYCLWLLSLSASLSVVWK